MGYRRLEVCVELYSEITPEDIHKYGLAFPLSPYFKDMLGAYEKWVIGG